MTITNISHAKAHLSALLERVQRGEEVIIGKAGKPIAKIVPFVRSEIRRQPGALKGKIQVEESFEDALPGDIVKAFEER